MKEPLTRRHSLALAALVVVNAVVLLGQLWPEGAPPFAAAVNIAFLASTLAYFAGRLTGRV